VSDVQYQRAGSIGHISRMFASQAESDVILWKQESSEALPNARLVTPYPKQLCQREICERRITSQLDKTLASHSVVQPVAFLLRSQVAPDYRWAQHLIIFIEQYRAMHLAS
jgi:hypothetical protein